jgi:hypothetical protein
MERNDYWIIKITNDGESFSNQHASIKFYSGSDIKELDDLIDIEIETMIINVSTHFQLSLIPKKLGIGGLYEVRNATISIKKINGNFIFKIISDNGETVEIKPIEISKIVDYIF